jgi:hypothetical protein
MDAIMTGIKITPADKWFSLCVRERAGWKCEYCETQYPIGAQGLHCSHYFGRGNWAVRLEPLDASAHCFGCHQKLSANPHLHYEWMKKRLGDKYELLVELSNDIVKGKAYKITRGIGEVAAHYKREHEKMLELRAKGITKRLEFVAWI